MQKSVITVQKSVITAQKSVMSRNQEVKILEHFPKSHVITRVRMWFWNMFMWNFCKWLWNRKIDEDNEPIVYTADSLFLTCN